MLKKIKSIYVIHRSVVLCAWILLWGRLPLWAHNEPVLVDKVIAKVDQQVILHSDLEEYYKMCQARGQQCSKLDALGQLVANKMIVAYAQLMGISASKQAIQKAYEQYMNRLLNIFGSQEKLSAYYNQPFYIFRKKIKRLCKEEALISLVQQKIVADVVVAPKEVCTYFNQLLEKPYYPSEVEVCQLVLYPTITSFRQDMAKNKLNLLKKQVQEGQTTFLSLVQRYANHKDPDIESQAEVWMNFGMGKPAYEAALLSMKKGQISEPILLDHDVYLIELIDRDANKYKARHLVYTLKPNEQEMALAEQKLNTIRQNIMQGLLSFEQAVKNYSEDSNTCNMGGVIPSSSGNMASPLQSMEILEPEVYFSIHNLKEGEITYPLLINKPKLGWRLLYLKKKIDAHAMNLKQDYEKIYQKLLKQKQNEKFLTWLKTVQSCFVIEFDPDYQQVGYVL